MLDQRKNHLDDRHPLERHSGKRALCSPGFNTSMPRFCFTHLTRCEGTSVTASTAGECLWPLQSVRVALEPTTHILAGPVRSTGSNGQPNGDVEHLSVGDRARAACLCFQIHRSTDLLLMELKEEPSPQLAEAVFEMCCCSSSHGPTPAIQLMLSRSHRTMKVLCLTYFGSRG